MKKYYYSLFAAASMMLAVTSCSEEESFIPSQNSEFTTFQVSLEGAVQSRTAGDGKTVDKLYYEVYLGEDKILDNYGTDKTSTLELVSLVDGKATVTMPLLKGERYNIMFWAQKSEGSIYNPDNLKAISLDYTKANSNMEANDAFFWGYADFKATSDATDVVLKRPFAQLNVATTVDDWNLAKTMIPSGLPITSSSVKVNGLANSFNVLNGEATGSQEVTFLRADLLPNEEKLTVNGESKYINLAMNYLLIPGKVEDEGDVVKATTTVDATFWRSEATDAEALFTLNVPNVPIQRNYRTNILGGLLADQKTFNIVVDANFDNEENIYAVNSDVEFEQALRAKGEYIVVDLGSNSRAGGQTYKANISAWVEEYYFGTADTKTITINANGNTIEFIHNNGDWNYIRCVNDDTKWIINDAHLTNSGKNDGPWNRHDIRFYNAVELNNVTLDKAIALLNDGKLNEVEITEDGDVYALWITADGQTVEINDLDITSAGRGIAIKDEYVDEPAKVTLKVKEANFDTKKKAAILVTSTAGADITLEKLDLSGVVADQLNAVWVDEDRADSFDLVKVEGGFKVLEGQEDASNPFLIEGNTVKVAKGVYGTLPAMANGVTIEAEEGTVFTGISGVAGENVTIKNVRFVNEDDVKALTGNLKGTIFENCTFESEEGARWCYAYGDVVFTNCTFGSETSKRGVHFDGGDGNVTFNNCNFYSFNALGSSIPSWKFNECNIKVSSKALSGFNGVNMYGTKYEYTNCTFEPNTYTDCTSAGNVTATYTGCSYTDNSPITSVIRFDGDASTCTVTFDGKQINFINKAEKIVPAIENGATEIYLVNGNYNMPTGNIQGKTVTFYGTKKAIITMGNGTDQSTGGASLTFDGLTLNFNDTGVGATDNYKGLKHAAAVKYKNCDIKGLQFLFAKNVTFEGCDLSTEKAEHCVWTYGSDVATFTGCNFTYVDRAVNCYSDQSGQATKATFTDCTFTKVAGKETTGAIETNSSLMTGLELNINNCTVNEGELWFIPQWDSKNGEKTIVTIDGKRVVATPAQLNVALADANEGLEIYLGKGEFGTILAKSNKTIIGTDNAKVDCVNLNGAANLTLKNIKFDAAKAVQGYDGKGNAKQYANIISGDSQKQGKGARNLVIEGCTFEGTFADGGAAIAFTDQGRGSGQSGNITIKNCTFNTQGGYVDIYTYYSGDGELNIEGNTFNSTLIDRPIYLGRYQSSTPVVVKGNKFNKVASFENAALIQAHSTAYTVSFAAENNEFAAANE